MAAGVGPLPEEEYGDQGRILSEINVTPLIDIFLVLLIVFMVASSVLSGAGASSGLSVNLPQGQNSEFDPNAPHLVIGVTSDGAMVIDGQAVDGTQLTDLLRKATGRDPNVLVVVHADRESLTGRAVEVMELAKQAGVKNLGIATQEPTQ